jgi:hypothetical protein
MSEEEEGGTPFEEARDASPLRVTPVAGKEALGTQRSQVRARTEIREDRHFEAGTN